MYYFALMAVIDRGQYLFDDFGCLLLTEALFFRYLVEQLTAVAVPIKNVSKDMQKNFNLLGYKKVPFLILKEFIQLQNVWVVELLENIYFIYKLLNLFLRQALLVQDLHCAQGLGLLVQTLSNLAICPSTYARAYFVEVFYESGVLLHKNCSRALDRILLLVNQFLLLLL